MRYRYTANPVATIQDLLNRIEPFCVEYKIGKSQFGRLVSNNQNIIPALRAGCSPTLDTVNKILEFMDKYKKNKDREMAKFFMPNGDTGLSEYVPGRGMVLKNIKHGIGKKDGK